MSSKRSSKKVIPKVEEGAPEFTEKIPVLEAAQELSDDAFGELAVDVFQTPDEIVLVTAIAGVRAGDLSITVTDGVLTISGRRNFTFTVDDRDYVSRECYWGAFKRSVILPDSVDAASITATFCKGILTVRVKKIEPVRTRMIEIQEE